MRTHLLIKDEHNGSGLRNRAIDVVIEYMGLVLSKYIHQIYETWKGSKNRKRISNTKESLEVC